MIIQTKAATLERKDNGVLEIRFKEHVKLTVDGVQEVLDARMELCGRGPYAVLVTLPDDIDFEIAVLAKDHYDGRGLEDCTYAVAWDTGSEMNEKLVDIFYRYFPQPFPVKTFPSEEEARAWLDKKMAEEAKE
ncbi:MAG: hypothetical protein ABIQ75_09170 [Flavobacteriales bacterium]